MELAQHSGIAGLRAFPCSALYQESVWQREARGMSLPERDYSQLFLAIEEIPSVQFPMRWAKSKARIHPQWQRMPKPGGD